MTIEELIDKTTPNLREITFHSDGRVIAKTGARSKFPKKLWGSRTAKHIGGIPNSIKTKEVLLKIYEALEKENI